MTVQFKNTNQLSKEEVLSLYNAKIKDVDTFKDEVQELVNLYAKNPSDNFMISDTPKTEVFQGDIMIMAKGTEMYNRYIKSFNSNGLTEERNLQEGKAVTGDHTVASFKDAKLTVEKGRIELDESILPRNAWNRRYDAKLVKCDKSIMVYHAEHGNITLPAGEYLCASLLDAQRLERVVD